MRYLQPSSGARTSGYRQGDILFTGNLYPRNRAPLGDWSELSFQNHNLHYYDRVSVGSMLQKNSGPLCPSGYWENFKMDLVDANTLSALGVNLFPSIRPECTLRNWDGLDAWLRGNSWPERSTTMVCCQSEAASYSASG